MAGIQYQQLISYNPTSLFPQDHMNTVISLIHNNIIREDNQFPGITALPGAIIASPSVPADPETDQNYVYDWIRDSAITMREIIHAARSDVLSHWQPQLAEVINNYISFSRTVQEASGGVSAGYGRWNLNGTPSPDWTVQNDGPALRLSAHIQAVTSGLLSSEMKDLATLNILSDLDYLAGVYNQPCINIWEEVYGDHFFTKKIIRRAFADCLRYRYFSEQTGAPQLEQYITELEQSLSLHLEGRDYFRSNITPGSDYEKGNDKNIDVLFALLYGEVGRNPHLSIDTRHSLSTAAAIIRAFIPEYPLNQSDTLLGLGPDLGRYPFDNYDGDTSDGYNTGHPWFISGNGIAAYFYKLASLAENNPGLTADIHKHFSELYQQDIESTDDIILLGDRHILTTQHHWDHCHMSEQYDRNTGYMKSVRDLTWSYATYLMAARLRAEVV